MISRNQVFKQNESMGSSGSFYKCAQHYGRFMSGFALLKINALPYQSSEISAILAEAFFCCWCQTCSAMRQWSSTCVMVLHRPATSLFCILQISKCTLYCTCKKRKASKKEFLLPENCTFCIFFSEVTSLEWSKMIKYFYFWHMCIFPLVGKYLLNWS